MDLRARERAEGGGWRGFDRNTLSMYIPLRPRAEEWWNALSIQRKYMAINMRATVTVHYKEEGF